MAQDYLGPTSIKARHGYYDPNIEEGDYRAMYGKRIEGTIATSLADTMNDREYKIPPFIPDLRTEKEKEFDKALLYIKILQEQIIDMYQFAKTIKSEIEIQMYLNEMINGNPIFKKLSDLDSKFYSSKFYTPKSIEENRLNFFRDLNPNIVDFGVIEKTSDLIWEKYIEYKKNNKKDKDDDYISFYELLDDFFDKMINFEYETQKSKIVFEKNSFELVDKDSSKNIDNEIFYVFANMVIYSYLVNLLKNKSILNYGFLKEQIKKIKPQLNMYCNSEANRKKDRYSVISNNLNEIRQIILNYSNPINDIQRKWIENLSAGDILKIMKLHQYEVGNIEADYPKNNFSLQKKVLELHKYLAHKLAIHKTNFRNNFNKKN